MFRMGGRSDDGIMSVRPGYQEGSQVTGPEYKFSETPVAKGIEGLAAYGINAPLAGILDFVNVPLNTLGRAFGYNPGFSGTKQLDALTGGKFSEYTGYDPDVAYFFGPTSAKTGFTLPSMQEKEDEASETDADKKTDDKKTIVTDKDEATQKLSDNDLKTMYEDLLPLFKSELSADDDELKRQKFLELAKFGANLLAQPGGDLTGAIGKAAAPSLEGLTRVAETRRRANEAAKTLALEAALKQAEPGSIRRQVRDIMALNPELTKKEALNKVLSTGSATKERTSEDRISTYATDLYDDDIVSSKTAGRKAAEAIEESGLGIGVFEKDPGAGDRQVGSYYILKNGKVGKYKGKTKDGKEDFAEVGDDDF